MQNIGIIAEFNPFHTGHKHLLDSIKGDNTAITVVMSGNFVQRGETAILPKAARAAAALKNGADLVIDLPTPWAMSTAQNFAFGGISILKNLGNVDGICFGSECGDIDLLKSTANILKSEEFSNKLASNLDCGETFAKIRSNTIKAWGENYEKVLLNPNDTLACEYIFAADRLAFKTDFSCIKRVGAAHDSLNEDSFVSATLLRKNIYDNNTCFAQKFMPDAVINLDEISSIKNIEKAILADLRIKATNDSLKNIADISEGIENRLKTAIMKARTLDELYDSVKTKRYTHARVRRLVLSAFLNIDSSFEFCEVPYIRVLGFTKKGEQILKDAKAKCKVPIITTAAGVKSLDEFGQKVWQLENAATDIFSLSLTVPQGCGNEYYHKMIKE